MSTGSELDVDSLIRFRSVVAGALQRIDGLQWRVPVTSLAPGALTRTVGGQLAEQGHAAIVDSTAALLESTAGLLRTVSDLAAASVDDYLATDGETAVLVSELEPEPVSRIEYEL